MQILAVYNFEIFHKLERTHSVNKSSTRLDYREILTLDIEFLSSLQSKLALSINMRDSKRMFNNAFELIDVQKLKSALSARAFTKIFESASTRSNAQKFKSSMNV